MTYPQVPLCTTGWVDPRTVNRFAGRYEKFQHPTGGAGNRLSQLVVSGTRQVAVGFSPSVEWSPIGCLLNLTLAVGGCVRLEPSGPDEGSERAKGFGVVLLYPLPHVTVTLTWSLEQN
jgi:hypothetical protein